MAKDKPPAEAAEERATFQEFSDGGPIMGKEAKIGLTVILVLLIVFGVVLYKRLTKSSDGSPAPVADSKTEAEPQGPELGGLKTAGPPQPAKVSKIVASKAESTSPSGNSKMAKLDDWTVVSGTSDKKDLKKTGNAMTSNDSSPPSFMPRLVGATSDAPSQAGDAAQAAPAIGPPGSPYGAVDQQPAAEVAQLPGPFTTNILADPVRSTNPQTGANPYASQDQANPLRGRPENAPVPDSYPHGGAYGRYSAGGAGQYQTPNYGTSPHSTYRTPPDPMGAPNQYQASGSPYYSGGLDQRVDFGQPLTADGSYVVQPNDSYWTISERVYGTGSYFRALAEHNRKQFPDADQLAPGEKISAPTVAELEKNYRDLCPKPEHREAAQQHLSMVSTTGSLGGKTYVVQEGDTLFDIARYELGKASRWAEIYQLNRNALGDQYDYLTPGMQLVMPYDRPAETLTQQPGSLLRR